MASSGQGPRGYLDGGQDQPLRVACPSPPAEYQIMCPLLRCPLKTLQKCEIALEKLKNDMAVVSGAQGSEVSALKEPDLTWKFYLGEQGGQKSLSEPNPSFYPLCLLVLFRPCPEDAG